MEHLMPGLAATIKVLGTPDITDELEQTIELITGLRPGGNSSICE